MRQHHRNAGLVCVRGSNSSSANTPISCRQARWWWLFAKQLLHRCGAHLLRSLRSRTYWLDTARTCVCRWTAYRTRTDNPRRWDSVPAAPGQRGTVRARRRELQRTVRPGPRAASPAAMSLASPCRCVACCAPACTFFRGAAVKKIGSTLATGRSCVTAIITTVH